MAENLRPKMTWKSISNVRNEQIKTFVIKKRQNERNKGMTHPMTQVNYYGIMINEINYSYLLQLIKNYYDPTNGKVPRVGGFRDGISKANEKAE